MHALTIYGLVAVVWALMSIAVGLVLGPIMRRCSEGYVPVEDRMVVVTARSVVSDRMIEQSQGTGR